MRLKISRLQSNPLEIEMFPEQVERHTQGPEEGLDRLLSSLKSLGIKETLPAVKIEYTLDDIEDLVEKMEDLVEKVDDEEAEAQA